MLQLRAPFSAARTVREKIRLSITTPRQIESPDIVSGF